MTQTGILVKAISGFYYVSTGEETVECRARGNLRRTGTPLVGDRVTFTRCGDTGVIESIGERKNSFIRPPIANIDKLYIVSAYRNPAPNTLIIDQLICMCEQSDIEPVIVFNKSDMGDFSYLADLYRNAGFEVHVLSCETEDGLDELKASLQGVCAFTGNSGVGKSTILNHLFEFLELKTGDVSDKLGRGRHTTRHIELYPTETGYVVDTPGFSTIELSVEDKDELAYLFRDFSEYLGGCRFTGCSHVKEKDCAILHAVHNGEIAQERFDSYCAMYEKLAAIPTYKK